MQASRVPRFSIVIPLFNRLLFTTICIRALAAVGDHADETEIVFVDNGSRDGTGAFLATLDGPVRIVTNTENHGFARACNQGAGAARGTYLIFLNNDTVPQPGWLRALHGAITGPDAPAVVGARLLFPDDTIQHAGLGFNARHEPVQLFYGEPAIEEMARESRPVPAVTGACLMVERERFVVSGGFDEGYRNGFEDLDFCCRVRAEGGVIWYEAGSALYHFESASEGRYHADTANYERFRERWGAWLAADPLARGVTQAAERPVRLARTYASGADMRRELERVIADATAYTAEYERLRAAHERHTAEAARQAAWVQSLEADARRLRDRNPLQRLVGKLLHM